MIEIEIKCNYEKLVNYLSDWKIDLTGINIKIYDGKWTFKTLGKTNGIDLIIIYLPRWLFIQREKAIAKIILHEYLHIKGLEKCLSDSKNCIMYESSWYKEIISMPFQWMNNWSLCNKCKKFKEEIS